MELLVGGHIEVIFEWYEYKGSGVYIVQYIVCMDDLPSNIKLTCII